MPGESPPLYGHEVVGPVHWPPGPHSHCTLLDGELGRVCSLFGRDQDRF